MKGIKKVLIGLLVIFLVIQLIHPARNIGGQDMPNDISRVVAMPAQVRGILKKSCYDCHSNHTDYPWYTYVQPIHWLMNSHIKAGKEELNFSEFATYSRRRQQNKLRSVANSLKDGSMPLSSYTLIHRNAILTETEKTLIVNWVENRP